MNKFQRTAEVDGIKVGIKDSCDIMIVASARELPSLKEKYADLQRELAAAFDARTTIDRRIRQLEAEMSGMAKQVEHAQACRDYMVREMAQ